MFGFLIHQVSNSIAGFMPYSLWKLAAVVISLLLILWSVFHIYENNNGQKQIGVGALIISMFVGLIFANRMNNYRYETAVSNYQSALTTLDECRDDLKERDLAIEKQNQAIETAKVKARLAEAVARKKGQGYYQDSRKASTEVKTAADMTKWFDRNLSEYRR